MWLACLTFYNFAFIASICFHEKEGNKSESFLCCVKLPVPEFVDLVFAKTSPKRSLSIIENERSLKMSVLGLFLRKLGLKNSGTGGMKNR